MKLKTSASGALKDWFNFSWSSPVFIKCPLEPSKDHLQFNYASICTKSTESFMKLEFQIYGVRTCLSNLSWPSYLFHHCPLNPSWAIYIPITSCENVIKGSLWQLLSTLYLFSDILTFYQTYSNSSRRFHTIKLTQTVPFIIAPPGGGGGVGVPLVLNCVLSAQSQQHFKFGFPLPN